MAEPLNAEELLDLREYLDARQGSDVPWGVAAALLTTFDDAHAEILRHHKDFERWEEMASKGIAATARARAAERMVEAAAKFADDHGRFHPDFWCAGRADHNCSSCDFGSLVAEFQRASAVDDAAP